MGRALLVATLLVMGSPAASAQALSTLHITVTLADATGKITPVARHALLISEEPPSTAPRRIFTTLAGTADVSLRPGRYAVESDQPVAFEGKSYEWSQRIDIVAGRDATLALTADNASVGTGTAAATSATPSDTDPSFLASQWQDSVVALWTPTQHASGFLVDARGLIVTNQRVVGTATSVEAQFTRHQGKGDRPRVGSRARRCHPLGQSVGGHITAAAAARMRPDEAVGGERAGAVHHRRGDDGTKASDAWGCDWRRTASASVGSDGRACECGGTGFHGGWPDWIHHGRRSRSGRPFEYAGCQDRPDLRRDCIGGEEDGRGDAARRDAPAARPAAGCRQRAQRGGEESRRQPESVPDDHNRL